MSEIGDKEVLAAMTHFDFSHSRKVVAGYQTWVFPFGGRIEFKPGTSVEEKHELIKAASKMVHRIVKADIRNTLPEIKALAGDTAIMDELEALYCD